MTFVLNTDLEKKYYKKKSVVALDNSAFFSNLKSEKLKIRKNNLFWSDKKQKKSFSVYLRKLRLKIFPLLCNELNKIHKKKFSKKSWGVIIFPWLMNYLENIYYRWTLIEKITSKKKINIIFFNKLKIKPIFDQRDFAKNINTCDVYNQFILQKIWTYFKNKKKKDINFNIQNDFFETCKDYPAHYQNTLKNSLFKIYDNLLSNRFSNQKYFIDLNINKIEYLKLCKSLKTFPTKGKYWLNNKFIIKIFKQNIANNLNIRKKIKLFTSAKNNFEKFLDLNLKYDLPQSFLEKFNIIFDHVKQIPLRPKVIISDNNYKNVTLFKFWLAYRIDKKTKFICADHGGTYGNSLRSMIFEEEIPDLYLTWFKSSKKKQKQLPVLHFSPKSKFYQNKKILFISNDGTKFPKYFNTGPISEEWLIQNKLYEKFFNNLNRNLLNKILIRLYPIKYNSWWTSNFLKKKFAKDQFLSRQKDYDKQIKSAKLRICTYPKTAFLQSLFYGPTVLLMNQNFYVENNKNQKIFNKLKKVNILFNDPIKMANFISKNWINLDEWWNSKETLIVRKLLADNFCMYNKNSIIEWSKILKRF